jgi:hypothetical protein
MPASASITTSQSLAVTITVSGNPTPTGSVTLSSGSYASVATALSGGTATITIPTDTLAAGSDTLTASYTPDSSSSSNYNSASGSGSVAVSLINPVVTISPPSSSITSTQSFAGTVSVSGGSGNPTPTGTVTLNSGSYTSAPIALNQGSASFSVPAGSLATGTDTLTAAYMPDAASSSLYNTASGTASITVSPVAAMITPTVTVLPAGPTITTAQSFAGTVTVSGGAANPAPTGTVTLSSGSYTSAAVVLSQGSASFTVPAGALATGNDTLTADYTPDAYSSSTYTAASGTDSVTVTASGTTYVLTVDSAAPSTGVYVQVSPPDNNGKGNGTAPFMRTFNAGTAVTLSVAADSGSYSFVSWNGCTSSSGTSCGVTMSAAATVTATYNETQVLSIGVSPNTATIGSQQQFTATVTGTGSYSKSVNWSVAAQGSSLSPGSIGSTGLYNPPYPAPPTVTVTATSVADPSVSGSTTVTLSQPAAAAGPALTVDAGNQTHAINPLVYGMNGYFLDSASAKIASPGVVRWGGDDVSRYNYKTTWTNTATDWYFENYQGAGNMFGGGAFNDFVTSNNSVGAATLGTVPVLGWVSNSTNACSFPQSAYPNQVNPSGNPPFNSYNGLNCGAGYYADGFDSCTSSGGCSIFGSDTIAAVTSISEPPPDITAPSTPAPGAVTAAWADSTWQGGWVNNMLTTFGSAAGGKGVAIWDLDNEPTWWSAVHRDVHPIPFTYDEVTNDGIGTALAIKAADPTAQVSGPVIDDWWAYFYSMQDIWNGSDTGPCYEPWGDPTDREAHGGVPLIEYYLKQFNNYSQSYGVRLLDYVDIHGYFAPSFNGSSVAFATAGDSIEQQARLNGTRVFWDPTYTDPNYIQPNYITDSNYTPSCFPAVQAPELVPMLKTWVANDYPGTKTSIDEYNFGGLESINGAVAEADILGIFGRQGLDMSALWPTNAYNTQGPGNYAFAMYRNYDLANDGAAFGDMALASSSSSAGADAEGQLAVYGALRTSDNALTVMVINKTFGDLTSTLTLKNFKTASTTAQAYLYSNANLNAIVAEPNVTVTPPASGGTASNIATKFPAQSITLLVVPQ